tara:strand:- start:485 stop:1015 length:531 start_codon:yes stop_codon:yes gene_type:complete
MSNLRLINETTFSGVATANLTDVFSSDFDIYQIVATGFNTTSGTVGRGRLRFITSGGSVDTSSNYGSASLAIEAPASGSYATPKNFDSYIDFVLYDNGQAGGDSAGVWYIYNPYNSTRYTHMTFQESHFQASYGNGTEQGAGYLKVLGSITGVSLYAQSGGSFDVKLRTYGLRRDT